MSKKNRPTSQQARIRELNQKLYASPEGQRFVAEMKALQAKLYADMAKLLSAYTVDVAVSALTELSSRKAVRR